MEGSGDRIDGTFKSLGGNAIRLSCVAVVQFQYGPCDVSESWLVSENFRVNTGLGGLGIESG